MRASPKPPYVGLQTLNLGMKYVRHHTCCLDSKYIDACQYTEATFAYPITYFLPFLHYALKPNN
jgi:hypothetical protein